VRVQDTAQLNALPTCVLRSSLAMRVQHSRVGRRLLLDKLDGAVEKYSAARQWHFFEICLGMAIAAVGWYICNLWYQGALSR
jgi:hypothetical protein